jgi:hypothetical protein
MFAQVYGDNAMKKTAVYKLVARFSEGRENVTEELKKTFQKFIKLCMKIVGRLSEA